MSDSLRYEYCPPHKDSRVDHVGTYKRPLPVSLERMYENTLDWEHLPHLHGSSFTGIDCLDAGSWGWRCRVVDAKGRPSLLELRLDRDCRRWITRNLDGAAQGAEIWTHVFVTDTHQMDIVIDYFVPGVPSAQREKVGMAYARSYEMLYDEDVWMMTERQKQIEQRIDSINRDDEVRVPVAAELPIKIQLSGRGFYVDRLADAWVTYPETCPHQLGPLNGGVDAKGIVVCPWHGYEFDVRSGACLTGHNCRLGKSPAVSQEGEELWLRWDMY